MEPIISPWIIYLVSIFSSANEYLEIISYISAVLFSFFIMCWTIIKINTDDESEEPLRVYVRKCIKYSIISLIVSTFLSIIVPPKNDIIAIVASNYVTSDLVETVGESFTEYFENIVKILNDDEENLE